MKDFTAKDVSQDLDHVFIIALKALLVAKRHVVDCVPQIFQQSFNHVDDLEALEICILHMIL